MHNRGLITEVAREWARLVQFRAGVYSTFQRRADAVFELIDVLAADTQARSPVELSPSPFFRRQYASIYDGLDAWKYDAVTLDNDKCARHQDKCDCPNPVGNNKPITIGHNYGALLHIESQGSSTWAPAWALERTLTDWTGVDLALEQVVRLVRCDDGWHIVTADRRYGIPLYIAVLSLPTS